MEPASISLWLGQSPKRSPRLKRRVSFGPATRVDFKAFERIMKRRSGKPPRSWDEMPD